MLIKNKDGLYAPPNWLLTVDDCLRLKDETFIPNYIIRKLNKIGIKEPEKIQALPAWYWIPRVGYWFFGTIVGRIEPPQEKEYKYASLEDICCFAKNDLLARGFCDAIHMLCLRALASRDNPNKISRKKAGKILKELQEIMFESAY